MLKTRAADCDQLFRRALGAAAGFFGAAGVALSALAAHRAGGDTLTTAATLLLLHGAPLLALSLAPAPRSALVGGMALALGALLFSGDLALRSLAGVVLWPLAAPTGGLILIGAWLWIGVGAAIRRAPGQP